MAKFYLRTQKASGSTSLYVDVHRPACGVRWRLNTSIRVDIDAWFKAHGSARALEKYYKSEEGKKVKEKADKVEGVIKGFFKDRKKCTNEDKGILEKEINDVVNLEVVKAKEELQKREEDAIKAKAEEEKKKSCQVWNYYEYFMKGIEDGSIRHGQDKKRYTSSTISSWKTFGKHLHGFLEARNMLTLSFEDIDQKIATAFVTYLEDKNLMAGTIVQQKNHFRKLCNIAAEDGKNTNGVSLRQWKSGALNDRQKRAEIVLTDEEIDALYDLKLSGYVEQCRDLWILGYFSTQRVSDYSTFRKESFDTNEYGVPVIKVTQHKTGVEVEIPIMDDRVNEICEKYNYNFPNLKRDAINRGIKMACRILSEKVPSLGEWVVALLSGKERQKEQWYIETKKRVMDGEMLHGEEYKRYKLLKEYADEHKSGDMLYRRDHMGRVIRRRWEIVSTHTTRRSRITNLHKSGYTDREIMAESGHQSIRNFETYMKMSPAERALAIYNKYKPKKEKLQKA